MSNDVHKALTGVVEEHVDDLHGSGLLTGLVSPATHVLMFMFWYGLGFQLHQSDDKSAWQFYVRYKNIRFVIRDWKRTTWSIDCADELPTNEVLAIAETLQKKITAAGNAFNKTLVTVLKSRVESGEFYLANSYHEVRTVYEHYRGLLKRALKRIGNPPFDRSENPLAIYQQFFHFMNRTERLISTHASAMVAFYFSYTELMLDVLFALYDPSPQTFHSFRSLTWGERFKKVLPLRLSPQLPDIYEALLTLKRSARDVLLHGFGDEAAIMVPFGHWGLVPISYESFSTSLHYRYLPLPKQEAKYALEVFEAFDEWLESDERSRYALILARSGLDIPMARDVLEKIRQRMIYPSAFENYLKHEVEKANQSSEVYDRLY